MTERPTAGPETAFPVVPDAAVCGCAGKTSLDRVVLPARAAMRERLATTAVDIGPDADVAALPLTDRLDRETVALAVDSGGDPTSVRTSEENATPDAAAADERSSRQGSGRTWALSATLADPVLGRDPETFAAGVSEAFRELGRLTGGPVTVGKGHAVQVANGSRAGQWTELLRPVGRRRAGYVLGNVDVVHAVPDGGPRVQARMATVHALNDCYAAGATDRRTIRPVVAVPEDTALAAGTVHDWFGDVAPEGVEILRPDVLDHGGDGWLFGATATATTSREPPLPTPPGSGVDGAGPASDHGSGPVRPGDEVVVHRPFGGLALASLGSTDDRTDGVRDTARTALTEDHRPVAEVVAEFRPAAGEPVDPSRHVLAATDVSGPGIRGVGKRIAAADPRLGLRVERLPAVAPAVDEAADRWILPDATAETNGPIALVGRPAVVDAVTAELATRSGCDPVRIGKVAATGTSAVEAAEGVELARYVETAPGPGGGRP